jgi:Fe-S cluster assembly iron-binding protein IscA
MLVVTPEATAFVGSLLAENKLPETYCLRLSAGSSDDGQRAVQISFTEEPVAGDEVAGDETPRVFVAPEIAPVLDGTVLDVESSGDGSRLVLHRG